MKKYVIKYADGSDQHEMQAIHDTKESAVRGLIEYIKLFDNPRSPFDFKIEVVDSKDVNEIIPTFEKAREALGLRPLMAISDVRKAFVCPGTPEDILTFLNEFNPHHINALIALNRLFTIAEAWNKEDGFVPDSADWNQDKWSPWFKYDEDAAGFVYAFTHSAPAYATATFGSRLCFQTRKRAEQFGKQFADLYNSAFLP